MVTFKFLKLSRTSLWVPIIASLLAVAATALHPALSKIPLTDLLVESIGEALIEYLAYAVGFFGLFWVVLHFALKSRQLSRRRWPSVTEPTDPGPTACRWGCS